MEYVIKNLKDNYIKGYLESIINNKGFDNNFKVKLISNLMNDIVNETKNFENTNKLESIVDKVCSNKVSEMGNRVLDKLDSVMEKHINKQDEKFEKLNKQLDYLKFKSDLEDGLLDYDTITDSALESDNENINLLASEYILTNTLKDLNILDEFEELKKNLNKE